MYLLSLSLSPSLPPPSLSPSLPPSLPPFLPQNAAIAREALELLVTCLKLRSHLLNMFYTLPHIEDFITDILLGSPHVDIRISVVDQLCQLCAIHPGVCVCVCVRERERKRESVCVCVRVCVNGNTSVFYSPAHFSSL